MVTLLLVNSKNNPFMVILLMYENINNHSDITIYAKCLSGFPRQLECRKHILFVCLCLRQNLSRKVVAFQSICAPGHLRTDRTLEAS